MILTISTTSLPLSTEASATLRTPTFEEVVLCPCRAALVDKAVAVEAAGPRSVAEEVLEDRVAVIKGAAAAVGTIGILISILLLPDNPTPQGAKAKELRNR